MAVRQEKLQIEFLPTESDPGLAVARVDEAVRRLARLIGRQIAREQFERRQREEQQRAGRRSN